MNTIFIRNKTFGLLGFASLLVLGTTSSAFAQSLEATQDNGVIKSVSDDYLNNSSDIFTITTEAKTIGPKKISKNKQENEHKNVILDTNIFSKEQELSVSGTDKKEAVSKEISSNTLTPIPGSTSTSSAHLNLKQNTQTQALQNNSKDKVAQADIGLGRATRGGSSYIGIAGNIGLGGDSALGDGNFMVISKVGLTSKISVRPAAVLGDDTVFLLPVTYDFSLLDSKDPFTEPLPIAPYLGLGAAVETGDDSEFSFLITGGVDVPLNSKFTATAAVNAAFFDETDVGLMIGIGYNLSGL